jgi:basic amino acid/polyamine antiporter, APA family
LSETKASGSGSIKSGVKIERKASGLVRAVGRFDALMMCVAAISVGAGQAFIADSVVTLSPGVSLYLWLILGFLVCLPHAFLYGQLGALVARSGGDYVFVSRNTWPWLGFAMNFAFAVGASLVLGGMQPWNATWVTSGTLWAVGLATKDASLINMAQFVIQPQMVFLIGTIALFGVLLIMLLPHSLVLRINNAMIILGTAGTVLIALISLIVGSAGFKANWDSLVGGMGYVKFNDVIPLAKSIGLTMGTGLAPTLGILLMPFWLYFGYHVSNFFSGEMEDVGTSAPISTVGALVFLLVSHLMATWATINMVGQEWWTSASYIYFQSRLVGAAPPFNIYNAFIASVAMPNIAMVWIVNILWSMWAFSLWLSYFYFISRCFFAHAFDRVLPVKMAYVTSRTHAPVVALLVTFLIAEIGLALSVYTTSLVQLNWTLMAVSLMAIAAATSLVYPFINRKAFEAAPGIARLKLGPIPLLSISGAVTLAVFISVIAAFLLNPASYGTITPLSVSYIAGIFLAGVVIFHFSRWYRSKTEGVDILMLYQEIPPA